MIKYQFIQRNNGWIVRCETFGQQRWLAVVRRGGDYFEHDWQLTDNNAHSFQTYEQAFKVVFEAKSVEISGYNYGHCLEVEL